MYSSEVLSTRTALGSRYRGSSLEFSSSPAGTPLPLNTGFPFPLHLQAPEPPESLGRGEQDEQTLVDAFLVCTKVFACGLEPWWPVCTLPADLTDLAAPRPGPPAPLQPRLPLLTNSINEPGA